MNLSKVSNIILIVLVLATVAITLVFALGGELPNQLHTTPVYTGTLLNWAYILLGVAAISAVIFPIVHLFTRPKEALKSFLGLALLAVIVLISYTISDGTPLNLIGYTGPDNVPSMLIFSDTVIFTMYFLLGGTVLAIVGTEIFRKVR